MKLRIADFNIETVHHYTVYPVKAKEYFCDFDTPNLLIEVNEKEFGEENAIAETINKPTIEISAIHRKFAEWLPLHNAFVLHSATFDVDGTGVAFAAHSGTGKTTHMMLWQKLLGDRMTIVNGDKPIIRFFEDEPLTLRLRHAVERQGAFGLQYAHAA